MPTESQLDITMESEVEFNNLKPFTMNIYLNKRIYESVTPAQFGRADHWNTESESEHNEAYEAYIKHIESFKSIELVGKHPFNDLDKLTKGKDYETENVCNAPYCDCKNGIPAYCRFNSQGKTIARAKKAKLSEPKVE